MHYLMFKANKDIHNENLNNFSSIENNTSYKINFDNDKNQGQLFWGSSVLHDYHNNMMKFNKQDNYFLIHTSNYNSHPYLLKALRLLLNDESLEFELIKPYVSSELFKKKCTFADISNFDMDERGYFFSATLRIDKNIILLGYSPVNGVINHSMIMMEEIEDKLIELAFNLLKDNDTPYIIGQPI